MTRTITVKGVGSVSVRPDYITLSLSVRTTHKDYEKAMKEADKRVNLLEKAAKSLGFEEGSLKTLQFDVKTEYKYVSDRKRVFDGYRCFYQLKLSFDFDQKRLLDVLSTMANSDANPEFDISFTVKHPEQVSAELLASAAENAREKAEILCRASGVELGQLITIDYNWGELKVVSTTRIQTADYSRNVCTGFGGISTKMEPDDINLKDSAAFVWEIK